MLPLADWPLRERARVQGVLADIDDTLTTEGRIDDAALASLYALKAAGFLVVLVTGRPAGWSKPFAASWPADAIVAENGALALLRGAPVPGARAKHAEHAAQGEQNRPGHGSVRTLYQQDAATRGANFARMQQVAARILREVPGATLAQDSAGRETDIALDHSEFTHLAPQGIEQVLRLMQAEGMQASVSSIHINGWFGAHDKLSGARWILHELFARELDAELPHWATIGDSTNDQVMFRHLPHSVGVANIRRFAKDLQFPPRYVCTQQRGAGFAEFAATLLAARSNAANAGANAASAPGQNGAKGGA